jgi:cysteine-rich repeat protein
VCGDGIVDIDEACDDAGESASCNADCSVAECGDAIVNRRAAEVCDDAGESASCNADCSVAECGDAIVNLSAAEECDGGGETPGDFCASDCTFETVVFEYTGDVQSIDLPPWATAVRIEVFGAQGGGSVCCDDVVQDDGGLGGYAVGTFEVLGGETLHIYVGGEGVPGGDAGFNGGGLGGEYGGGGGGASDVRVGGQSLTDRLVVAGGGGGGNCGCPDHGVGGAGGGLLGDDGSNNDGMGHTPGGGGTQADGGLAGSSPGEVGALGVGGSGFDDPYHIAGGGGGYYGGGSAYAAGGGGGSSWMGDGEDTATKAGVQSAHGRVVVRLSP